MKQVASDADIPTSTYRDWEYGRTIQGTPYVKLASVLGVSLYELLTGERPKFRNILSLIECAEKNLEKAKAELSPLL